MKIHYLQHVPFEGLGSMESLLKRKGHQITSSQLYAGHKFLKVEEFDWLIVMGGPMGIYDELDYPWLAPEKAFIKDAINHGKIVLGICLGAQLIAHALGAKVTRNRHREIGWFPINRSSELSGSILKNAFPQSFEAFHWHGDTFELPSEALPVGSSEACANQGFIFKNRVIGFQFHLETTREAARALIENCRGELDGSRYVQSETELLNDARRFGKINGLMDAVLQALERNNP